MNYVVKIVFFILTASQALAQIPAEETVDYLYKKHLYLGPSLSTSGIGLVLGCERNLNFKNRIGLQVSFNHLKSDREFRKTNPIYEDSKSYVYGKINSVLTGKLFINYNRLIIEKKRIRGVNIHFVAGAGLSFAWIKPVYLKIREPLNNKINTKPRDERYDPEVHFEENIYGRSNYFTGFNEGKSQIGLITRVGLLFDVSKKENKIIAVELGVQAEKYPKAIPLFYIGNNTSFFPALYASVIIGLNNL